MVVDGTEVVLAVVAVEADLVEAGDSPEAEEVSVEGVAAVHGKPSLFIVFNFLSLGI